MSRLTGPGNGRPGARLMAGGMVSCDRPGGVAMVSA